MFGAKETAQWLATLADLPEDLVPFPAPTRQFTLSVTPSPEIHHTPWPLCACTGMYMVQTYIWAKHPFTKISNERIKKETKTTSDGDDSVLIGLYVAE